MKKMEPKTFRDVAGKDWPLKDIPGDNDSFVEKRSYELYYKPMDEFDAEDIRFIVGQNWNLPYVVPKAIDLLRREPLAGGDRYAGAILESLLSIDENYWTQRGNQREAVLDIVDLALRQMPNVFMTEEVRNDLMSLIQVFLSPR